MIIRDRSNPVLIAPSKTGLLHRLEDLAGEKQHAIYDTRFEGDKLVTSHVQAVDSHLEHVDNLVRFAHNGFSAQRKFQQIAHIPDLLWVKLEKRYGVGWHQNQKLFSRWLRSEEGAPYRVARNP